jgi:hypothetical protein
MLVGIWEREDAKYKPHLMFGLKHDLANNERLLGGEVLSTLAAIKSCMESAVLQGYVIVPVRPDKFTREKLCTNQSALSVHRSWSSTL